MGTFCGACNAYNEAFETLKESRYVLVCVLEDVCEVMEKLGNRCGFLHMKILDRPVNGQAVGIF